MINNNNNTSELQNCVKISSHTSEPVNQLESYILYDNVIIEIRHSEKYHEVKKINRKGSEIRK